MAGCVPGIQSGAPPEKKISRVNGNASAQLKTMKR